ncbi:MAG: Rrf2 family transcriptional regulator [Vicingaceae bacterium]
MFSKACEYGIRSAIFIAQQSIDGKRVSIKEVSKALDSPEAYTSKILQQLKHYQIIDSTKGPRGGFSMESEKMANTTLKEIVFAFDGDSIYKGCGLGLKQCNANKPCPVHHQFAVVRDQLTDLLENTTVQSLGLKLNNGLSFLRA